MKHQVRLIVRHLEVCERQNVNRLKTAVQRLEGFSDLAIYGCKRYVRMSR